MQGLNEWKLTRREAIVSMGLLAASTKTALGAEAATDTSKPQIALQLYTMRGPAKTDLAGTLKQVRDMGWEYVQWSGMPDLPADKIREALDTAGLKAMAAHVGIESFETDFDAAVQFWKTVGVEYVGPGGMMSDCSKTLEGWLSGAKRLDALGAKLREAGLHLTFHNHTHEFEKFPGDPRCKEDILLESTDPQNLFAEFDVAWVQAGKADPVAYIRKYKGRCPTIHAKDLSGKEHAKHPFAPLGQGILDWPAIFAAGRDSGVQWYIYEQDQCDEGPFEAAKISYAFLTKNLL